MDLRDLQTALNARGWKPPLTADGQWGSKTETAVIALLNEAGAKGFTSWPQARKQMAAVQAVLHLQGIDAGAVDGLAGPQTQYALDVWAARQRGDTSVETWRDSAPVAQSAPGGAWPRQSGVPKSSSTPLHAIQKAYHSSAAFDRGGHLAGNKAEIAATDVIGYGALFEGENAKWL